MKDFVGKEIPPGDYIARGGKGNGPAEYGMIAYRVLGIKNGKVSAERLQVSYPGGKSPPVARLSKATIANGNSCIVFQPPAQVQLLFSQAEQGVLEPEARTLIGHWLHGTEHQHPLGRVTKMEQKYLDMADAVLEAVYETAPDIFSDVWSLLAAIDAFEVMRENVAKAIQDAESLP